MMNETVKKIGAAAVAATAMTIMMTAPVCADDLDTTDAVQSEVVEAYEAEPETVEVYEAEPETAEVYEAEPEAAEVYETEPGAAEVCEAESETVEAYEAEPETVEAYEAEPELVEGYEMEQETTEVNEEEQENVMSEEETLKTDLANAEQTEESARAHEAETARVLQEAQNCIDDRAAMADQAGSAVTEAEQVLTAAVKEASDAAADELAQSANELSDAEAESNVLSKERDTAKMDLNEAENTVADASEKLELAKDAAPEAMDTLEEKRSSVDKAEQGVQEAEAALEAAKAAEAAASEAVIQANAEMSDAEDKLAEASAAKKAAEVKAEQASANLETAKAAEEALKTEATEAIRAAEAEKLAADKALEKAEKAAADAAAAARESGIKAADGVIGFYKENGKDEAVRNLTECRYNSYINSDDKTDAIDLDNVKKVFDHIRKCNELRARHGLDPLLVSDELMACAQADADYSDTIVDHARQFNVGENCAWNTGSNPFLQWYDKEKAIYDSGAEGVTGHYENIINPYFTVTGFGISTRGTMHGWITYAQTFDCGTKGEVWTVDEYEKRFLAYYDSVMGAKKAAEEAEADRSKAAETAANVSKAAEQARTDYASKLAKAAENVSEKTRLVETYDNEASDTALKEAQAEEELKERQAAYNAAAERAMDSGHDRNDAQEDLTRAQESLVLAKADLEAAEELCSELADAEQVYADAVKARDEATRRFSEADAAFKEAEERVAEMSEACAKAADKYERASGLTPEKLIAGDTDDKDFAHLNNLAQEVRDCRGTLGAAKEALSEAEEELRQAYDANADAQRAHALALAELTKAQLSYDDYMAAHQGQDEGVEPVTENEEVLGPDTTAPGSADGEMTRPGMPESDAGTSNPEPTIEKLIEQKEYHAAHPLTLAHDASAAGKALSTAQDMADTGVHSSTASVVRAEEVKTGDNGPMPYMAMLLGSLAALGAALKKRIRE